MKKIYWFMFLVSLAIYICQNADVFLPKIINNYLNDLLCIPVVLGISTSFGRKLKNKPNFQLPAYAIIVVVAYFSITFELFLPYYNERYTADWVDVFLYILGGFIFYLIEKSKIN